jgi:hypothetical protein
LKKQQTAQEESLLSSIPMSRGEFFERTDVINYWRTEYSTPHSNNYYSMSGLARVATLQAAGI